MDKIVKDILAVADQKDMKSLSEDEQHRFMTWMDDQPRVGLRLLSQFFESDDKGALSKIHPLVTLSMSVELSKFTQRQPKSAMLMMMCAREIIVLYSAAFTAGIAFATTQMNKPALNFSVKKPHKQNAFFKFTERGKKK